MENGVDNGVYEDAVGTSSAVDVCITAASVQGGRRYMEDRVHIEVVRKEDGSIDYIYAGVYDGHGGAQASEYVRLHLLNNIRNQKSFESKNDAEILHAIRLGFLKTHQNMQKISDTWPRTASGYACTAGTTASCMFIRDGKVYLGHVGDSAIFLLSEQPNGMGLKDNKLTEDHKPEDPEERTRIEMAGGAVMNKAGVSRVVWSRPIRGHRGPIRRSTSTEDIPFLAIARSLGDFWSMNQDTHEYVVSPEPDLDVHTLRENNSFIVLATDGLTNVLSGKALAALIDRIECDEELEEQPEEPGAHETNHAHLILQHSLTRWGHLRADNISVVCLKLKSLEPPAPQSVVASEPNMNISKELRNFPTAAVRVCNETTQRMLTKPVPLVYNGAVDSVIRNTRLPNVYERPARTFEGPGFVVPEMTRKAPEPAYEEPTFSEPTATPDSNQEVPDIPILDQSLPEVDAAGFPSKSVDINPHKTARIQTEETAQNGEAHPLPTSSVLVESSSVMVAAASARVFAPGLLEEEEEEAVDDEEEEEEVFEEASSQTPVKLPPTPPVVQASPSTPSGHPLSPFAMLESLRSSTALTRSTYLSQLSTSFTFTRSITVSPRKSTIPQLNQAEPQPAAVSSTRVARSMDFTNAPPRPLKRGLTRTDSEDPLPQATAPKRSRLWSFVSDVFSRYTSSSS